VVNDDLNRMSCDRWREAVSALIDGEDPGMDGALVDAHLRRCADCQTFKTMSVRLRRAARVRPAETQADLAAPVVKAMAMSDKFSVWTVTRLGLVVVAVQIVVLSVGLMAGTPDGHEARHVGAFAASYAIALLAVAHRPGRARAVLPVSCVLAGALVITAVVDGIRGNVAWLGEFNHLPELVSLPLVWLLARPQPDPQRPRRREPLRLVDDQPASGREQTA
jgi:predicted anti-sigma-YlaC factor YlaD